MLRLALQSLNTKQASPIPCFYFSLCRIFKSALSTHRRGNPSIDPNNDRLCRATAAATWLSAAMSCLLPTYQKAFVHAFGGLSCPLRPLKMSCYGYGRERRLDASELSWVSSAGSRRYDMRWHHPPEPIVRAVAVASPYPLASVPGDDLLIELESTHIKNEQSCVLRPDTVCVCVWMAQCWLGHHCLFGVHASTPAVEVAAKLIGPVFLAESHFPIHIQQLQS